MTGIFTIENIAALFSLTALEIVLGVDNIVFIAILVGKLPAEQREIARRIGLALAMVTRILLLLTIRWIMLLTSPLFQVLEHPFSGRDLILLIGGLFLIWKATHEIHGKIEHVEPEAASAVRKGAKFTAVITQIVLIDIVFSLDSVITAVGMSDNISIMITAIVIAVGVMMLCARSISDFIEKHPTFKMLALAFLLMVGTVLVADGFGKHIERGYIYTAMAFSLLVEVLNMRAQSAAKHAAKVS